MLSAKQVKCFEDKILCTFVQKNEEFMFSNEKNKFNWQKFEKERKW